MTDDLTPQSREHDAPVAVDLAYAPDAPHRRGVKPFVAAIAAMALGAAALAALATSGGNERAPVPLALQGVAGSNRAAAESDRATLGAPYDAMYPMFEYRYRLAGALKDLGQEAPVYRLVAPALDAADVARMAAALDISGEVVAVEGGGWEASDADRTLQISGDTSAWFVSVWNGPSYREIEGSTGSSGGGSDGSTGSGSVETGEAEPPVVEDPDNSGPDDSGVVPEPIPEPEPIPVPEDLPDDGQAIGIAKDMLDALGVPSGDWQFEVMDSTMMGIAVACAPTTDGCTDTPTESVVLSRAVVAHRLVDGHIVSGLDWYIEIGDHGVVQSVGGVLADIERVADYPLRSTTDVFEDLQSGDGGIFGEPVALALGDTGIVIDCPDNARCAAPEPECIEGCPEPEIVEVTVTDVSLGAQVFYAADENGNPVQYVVPMYHFIGSLPDGTEWSADLLAISDEYVTPPTVVEPTPDPGPVEPPVGAPEPAPVPEDPPATQPGEPTAPAFDAEADLVVGDTVEMPLDLNFHCGVTTVRFDARWWDTTPPWPGSGGGSPSVEVTAGKLTLVDETHASWTNGAGVDLDFAEHPGAFEPLPCA